MTNKSLNEVILNTLFAFAQDYVDAEADSGRTLADKAAYEFVDTIHNENIYLRQVYAQFYENEKDRWSRIKEVRLRNNL